MATMPSITLLIPRDMELERTKISNLELPEKVANFIISWK